MLRRPSDDVYRAVDHEPDALGLVHLPGGGELRVRLVVQAPAASSLEVELTSVRSGLDLAQASLQ